MTRFKNILMPDGKDAGLLAISFHLNFTKFKISGLNYLCYFDTAIDNWNIYPKQLYGKPEIIGIVTEDTVSFDVENYVGCKYIKGSRFFADYSKDEPEFFSEPFESAASSLYSLLEYNGFIFSNPLGELVQSYDMYRDKEIIDPDGYMQYCSDWKEAQSRVVEKLVILKTVK